MTGTRRPKDKDLPSSMSDADDPRFHLTPVVELVRDSQGNTTQSLQVRENENRKQRLSRLEHRRAKYMRRIVHACSQKRSENNPHGELDSRSERALFVLGRPLSEWNTKHGMDLSPTALEDMIRVFFADGGSKYYCALLLTADGYPHRRSVQDIYGSDMITGAAKLYSIPTNLYAGYVDDRLFERVFLIMNSISTLERYQFYVDNPDTSISTGDLLPISSDDNVFRRKHDPLPAFSPPPTTLSPPNLTAGLKRPRNNDEDNFQESQKGNIDGGSPPPTVVQRRKPGSAFSSLLSTVSGGGGSSGGNNQH